MLLIKPSFEILAINIDPLQQFIADDKLTTGRAQAFTDAILNRGHESVIDHATAKVRFICDRGVAHDILRYRFPSYSKESTMDCYYKNGHITYIIPPWTTYTEGEYTNNFHITTGRYAETMWAKNCLEIEQLYKNLLDAGWQPEQARSVLPNSLKTEIAMWANLREWRHFFRLRTSAAAHPQMREVATPLLEAMRNQIPVIFDDLVFSKRNAVYGPYRV